jgi:hypothetical protein
VLKKAIEAWKTQPGVAVPHLLSVVCELVAQAFLPVLAFFGNLILACESLYTAIDPAGG